MSGLPDVHTPNSEYRATVRALAGFGIPNHEIAKYLNIDEDLLQLFYQSELETGATHANAEVAKSLFNLATKGGDARAAIFWLKNRAGWTDRRSNAVNNDANITWSQALTEARTYEVPKSRPRIFFSD